MVFHCSALEQFTAFCASLRLLSLTTQEGDCFSFSQRTYNKHMLGKNKVGCFCSVSCLPPQNKNTMPPKEIIRVQNSVVKETIQKLSTADSRCYEGRYVDKAFHITSSNCGPCCDLSCHEIVSILHCAVSQPSISPFCFWQQDYAALVAMERTSISSLCSALLVEDNTIIQFLHVRACSG